MSISFITTGIAELDARFANMAPKMQKSAVRKAARAAGKLVLAEAAGNLNDFEDDGQLKKSLKVRALKRSRTTSGVQIVAGSETQSEETPWYAGFVELGTGMRWTNAGNFRGYIFPRKYLRPALYDNEKTIRAHFINELKHFIAEEGRKGTRGGSKSASTPRFVPRHKREIE